MIVTSIQNFFLSNGLEVMGGEGLLFSAPIFVSARYLKSSKGCDSVGIQQVVPLGGSPPRIAENRMAKKTSSEEKVEGPPSESPTGGKASRGPAKSRSAAIEKDGEIRDVEVRARLVCIGASSFLLQTWHDLTSARAGNDPAESVKNPTRHPGLGYGTK
jgi:hypothetical protein